MAGNQKVTVNLGERSYDIMINSGAIQEIGGYLKDLVHESAKIYIVTNPTIHGLHGQDLENAIESSGHPCKTLTVPDGEEYKTLDTISSLYDRLIEDNVKRTDVILAFGGGVIGDMAGFLAATLLRGLTFVQVPTTLLAQVDSSIGGKVGVNHARGKNLIGAFYQPRLVLVDPNVLKTLPKRELLAGYAEVIKYGCIAKPSILDRLQSNAPGALAVDYDFITQIIADCCAIKAKVVSTDERESGHRAILNYGHTIGHAIEAATGYRQYLHGEAVMLGMVAAAWIARHMSLLSDDDYQAHLETAEALGLPTSDDRLDVNSTCDKMRYDKKWTTGGSIFVLLEKLGQPRILRDIDEDIYIKAISHIKGDIS